MRRVLLMKRQVNLRNGFIVLILGITLIFSPCSGVEESQPRYAKAIKAFEEFVAEQMKAQKVPGLSVGFMKDDFIWTKGFGYADLENMSPAKPESSYRLASVTKTITAIAVLKLVEEGKMDLDSEVQTYVPYFPKKDWPVTIRQLLGHLGGISHYKNQAVEEQIKVHKNTAEAIEIFKDFDLVAEPGTKYNYSSYGFNLLGAAIEGASGKSYGEVIKEHIFAPLGMDYSRLDNPVDLIPNRVRGYRIIAGEIKNSEYVDVSSRFAGGGTRSTVIDLLKYAKGIFEGKILKEETYEKMFTSMVLKDNHFTGYGMGWGVSPIRGHFTVSHGGSQPETRTHLVLLPGVKLAIALASNREGLDLRPFYTRLIELVLDEDIDSNSYASDRVKQTMYSAFELTFNYGLSHFERYGEPLSQNNEDLLKGFSFFNVYANENAIKDDYKKTKEKIDDGIHPVSNQVLTTVGSFIADTLEKEYGREALHSYCKKGPLAFFQDYIAISNKKPELMGFRFEENLKTLISRWKKDWDKTYTAFVRFLTVTSRTDFEIVGPKLKESFLGAEFYPDFSAEISNAGIELLVKNEVVKALKILNLNKDLYPNSPIPYSSLGFAHVWTGKVDEARSLFKRAYEQNPYHPVVSVDQFMGYGSLLARAKKTKEDIELGNIALEIFPKEAQLYVTVGDKYSQSKQKEKAIEYYRKALELDPKLENVKKKLESMEKK